jgi:hypothetical protein
MNLKQRFKNFLQRQAQGRLRAQAKAISEKRHAEAELRLDDILSGFYRETKSEDDSLGYPSSLSDGPDGREDW